MCIFIQKIKANQAALTEPETPLNDMSYNIKPLNLQGGQWWVVSLTPFTRSEY